MTVDIFFTAKNIARAVFSKHMLFFCCSECQLSFLTFFIGSFCNNCFSVSDYLAPWKEKHFFRRGLIDQVSKERIAVLRREWEEELFVHLFRTTVCYNT